MAGTTSRARHGLEALAAAGVTAVLLWALVGVGEPPPPTPPPCDGATARIVSVGDILLGEQADRYLDKKGWQYPFEGVAPLLRDADLVMGNLEAPITEHDQLLDPTKEYSYRLEAKAADTLVRQGFGVLALANNHTKDYGTPGLADTLDQLERVGITPLGAGLDEASARAGTVVELQGTRVGLLAYMAPYGRYPRRGWFAEGDGDGVAALRTDNLREDIQRLQAEADVVIVHLHFGRNYKPTTRYQRRLARAAIDLGADAVNGHHSHVAQGVELYRGKPIVYSLGNFTFGTSGRFPKGEQGYGLVATYQLCSGLLRAVELDLIGTNNRIVKYKPTIIAEEEARPVLEALVEPYGTGLDWHGSTAVLDLSGSSPAPATTP